MLAGICIALAVIAIAMVLISLYGIRLNGQLNDLIRTVNRTETDTSAERRTSRTDWKSVDIDMQIDRLLGAEEHELLVRDYLKNKYKEPHKCRGCGYVYMDCLREAELDGRPFSCKENKHKCKDKCVICPYTCKNRM